MKTLKALLITLFVLSGVSSIAQMSDTLSFLKGGILYQGKRYMKPAQIAPILSKYQEPQINTLFSKYKTNRGIGSVFGFLGGFGIGYSISSLIFGRQFQTGIFAGGVGATAIGLIFNGNANKSLKQAIRLYNGKQVGKEVSISPLFYQEYSISHVGIAIKL